MGTRSKISFFEALKDTFSFLFKSDYSKRENEENDILDDPDSSKVPCPRCQHPFIMVNQLIGDFLNMVIYQCPNCGVIKEVQFDQQCGEILKEVTLFNKFIHSSSSYMEVIHQCKFNEYALDRLWEVAGVLCYPILMKTQFSDNVDLVFIPVQDDLSMPYVDGFIISDDNLMVGKVRVQKTDCFSYFLNPYLYKIPHSTYLYATTPVPFNESASPVLPIRYRFKTTALKKSYLCELSIIEDFPISCFGLEVYVKFGTFTNLEHEPLLSIIHMIDLKSIILATESHIDENQGIYIQMQRLLKNNLYSESERNITKDMREHFYDGIEKFFTVVE